MYQRRSRAAAAAAAAAVDVSLYHVIVRKKEIYYTTYT